MSDDRTDLPPPAPAAPAKPANATPGFPTSIDEVKLRLRQLWEGEIPLAQTFWIYYFIIVFILKLLGNTHSGLGNIFDVAALIWAGFMVKPIMASADHYTGDRIWAILAKVAAIIIAVAVLSDLLSY